MLLRLVCLGPVMVLTAFRHRVIEAEKPKSETSQDVVQTKKGFAQPSRNHFDRFGLTRKSLTAKCF